MRFFIFAQAFACVASTLPVHAANLPEGDRSLDTASRLVEQALRAECDGKSEARSALLLEALRADPESMQVHWHLGQIFWQGRWRSYQEVSDLASEDKKLSEYRALRDQSTPAIDHRALARWCTQNGLTREARVHWVKVREQWSDDDEATSQLGLKRYKGGRWLTSEQMERARRQEFTAKAALKQWLPVVSGYRKQFETGRVSERKLALDSLRSIRDPNAIVAMETVTTRRTRADGAESLQLAVLDALEHMPRQAATDSLVRFAVAGCTDVVCTSAVGRLKSRNPDNYLPRLLELLVQPVNRVPTEIRDGQGHVIARAWYQRGAVQDICLFDWVYDYDFELFKISQSPVPFNAGLPIAHQVNMAAKKNNPGVFKALADIVGTRPQGEPVDWWQLYYRTVGFEIPDEVPVSYSIRRGTLGSCFVAGTPVWTLLGAKPIEQLRVGDHVLAQDATTGELMYKPVLVTSTRSPTEMFKIGCGADTITATWGHPFWVSGKGWRMARDLKPGMLLHSVDGPVTIDNVEEAPPRPAHNLIVADFASYFVGSQRLLVHDNTIREPTDAIVPGLGL